MSSFALYRLPHDTHATLVEQTDGLPSTFFSTTELDSHQGFVVAPFHATPDTPIVLIRPDRVVSGEWRLVSGEGKADLPTEAILHSPLTTHPSPSTLPLEEARRRHYSADFAVFHRALMEGQFQKLVLSRRADEPLPAGVTPVELFRRACQLYPRLFIALVSTPQSGTWLTATPELLLEGEGDHWHTVALAGTMSLHSDEMDGEGEHLRWSTKNIQEQRYVASYVADRLKPFATAISEEGPRTVRAAHLVHLRSDFTFTLLNNARVGALIHALHPTPAVCGLPKEQALSFITGHEHAPRLYYSGFMGLLNIQSSSQSEAVEPSATQLYVTLRCMHILPDSCQLYAGGGLLRESEEQKEWRETEAKLATMRNIIHHVQQ